MVDTVIPCVGHERESLVSNLPGLRPDEPYFNAGVLLLDLNKLRALNASASPYAQLLRTVECRYADQSILNGAFHGQWKSLPAQWNRQVLLGREFNVFPDQRRAIWHFSSKLKPWHFHRRRARGLLKQWQDERDAMGWTPTVEPTVWVTPSFGMDLLKQTKSWIKCGGSKRRDLSALTKGNPLELFAALRCPSRLFCIPVMKSVSVVINTYNYGRFVVEAVTSARSRKAPPPPKSSSSMTVPPMTPSRCWRPSSGITRYRSR